MPLRVDGFVRSNATFSGGTFASALTAMGRGRQMLRAAHERRLHEPRLVGRRARAPLGAPRFSRETGAWALPLPTLDPQIVARSARGAAAVRPGLPLPALRGGQARCRWRLGGVGGGGRAAARWPNCRPPGAG